MPSVPAKKPPAAGTKTWRYVGWHAHEFFLEDGSCPWVAPGDYIDLSDADFDNPANVEMAGLLVDASALTPNQLMATEVPVEEVPAEVVAEPTATE